MEAKSFHKSDTRIKFDDPLFIEAPWDRILTTFLLSFGLLPSKCNGNIISLSGVKLNSHS